MEEQGRWGTEGWMRRGWRRPFTRRMGCWSGGSGWGGGSLVMGTWPGETPTTSRVSPTAATTSLRCVYTTGRRAQVFHALPLQGGEVWLYKSRPRRPVPPEWGQSDTVYTHIQIHTDRSPPSWLGSMGLNNIRDRWLCVLWVGQRQRTDHLCVWVGGGGPDRPACFGGGAARGSSGTPGLTLHQLTSCALRYGPGLPLPQNQ